MGIVAKKAERLSILRHYIEQLQIVMTASAATKGYFIAPCDGELVDVIAAQPVAGAGGTSLAIDFQKQKSNVAMLATNAVLALASGAYAAVDARKKITKAAGDTYPVLSATRANRRVKKGDQIVVTVTPTGTYSVTFPTVAVTILIAADF